MRKTVSIVEDDSRLRDQLVEIVGTASDLKCVGAFGSAEEALRQIPSLSPDVVLMDIKLPGMSGIQCVAQLKKLQPGVQTIIVTVYKDSESIFKALQAGADGYLVKSCPPSQLLNAVRDVTAGGAPISSHIARRIVEHFRVNSSANTEQKELSPRENQVLTLLASGFIYKEIADQLGIGVTTTRTHVKNICEKMHVRNRVEAVAKHSNDSERNPQN